MAPKKDQTKARAKAKAKSKPEKEVKEAKKLKKGEAAGSQEGERLAAFSLFQQRSFEPQCKGLGSLISCA